MNKHLLLTIGDDPSYLYGIRFVNSFFKNKEDLNLTLFYVTPRPGDGTFINTFEQHQLDEKLVEEARGRAKGVIEEIKKKLVEDGFNPEKVICKLLAKRLGAVRDIIDEGRVGLYDAIVLGRRGYKVFESVLYSSVTRQVLEEHLDAPIWICRQPEDNRRHVLLCVDGSETAYRAADHVGFILKDQPYHSITLLNVDVGEGIWEGAIFAEATKRLVENGIAADRISTLMVESHKVARTIIQESEKGSFAAVAIGRVGRNKPMVKEWLVGSRAKQLLEDLKGAALWITG
ncbi:MAG: universal stress protein [Deltaproteobacteria bacterium]|nr:universal stress protein [Deltaproteobacteria bacterium]